MDHKAPEAFRTISEVADELDLPQHVLRFWESRFRDIKPMKRGGGRRYYRPDDVDLLRGIRHLLYGEGYTIRGVQRILRDQGVKFVQAVWHDGAPQPPHVAASDEDYYGEETETPEPLDVGGEGGLRGRLSSLVGRDLSDRHDDAVARPEPPLKPTPMPRIEPVDRAIHGGTPLPPQVPRPASMPSPPPMAPVPSPMTSMPASMPGRLGREDFRKLHAALHELGECRKLLDALMARAD